MVAAATRAVLHDVRKNFQPSWPASSTSRRRTGQGLGNKTAEAIRYALTRREALERFLMDGRIDIDSNIVERASVHDRKARAKNFGACIEFREIRRRLLIA
jgi:hypothetical protein